MKRIICGDFKWGKKLNKSYMSLYMAENVQNRKIIYGCGTGVLGWSEYKIYLVI